MRIGPTLILIGIILFTGSCSTSPDPGAVAKDDRPEGPGTVENGPQVGGPRRSNVRTLEAERLLRERVRASQCEAYLKELTRQPHVAGSRRNGELAEYLVNTLREFGFQIERHKYQVLLPYPVHVGVEMIEPVAYSAGLREEPLELDLDTRAPSITPYNAFTPDCDITAEVVYANYARREDFEKLEALGVNCRGRIVIARYGHIYRGAKVRIAEEFGAAGLILYSDPADDGYTRGDPYPHGRFRPSTAVERGSILDITQYPGDPGTPGRASLPGVEHLTFDAMESLPTLPTTCISQVDARPILENLGGRTVPEGWQGGIPITYHIGDKDSPRVRLHLEMDYRLRPIENITATLTGLRCPDEVIIVGNHRDAWGHGAIDPGSGTAVLLETARVLADAREAGQGLDRSVRFAFWDAEEFGIIGSTEYGEQYAERLKQECVAYINVDAAVSGPNMWVAGVPTMSSIAEDVFGSIRAPGGQQTLLDSLRGKDGRIDMHPLGSGSDYTVFLEHLGIDCLDFSSSGANGVYHSGYDTYVFMKRFGDPGFVHHAKMAGTLATLVSRIGRAGILRFDFGRVGAHLLQTCQRLELQYKELDLSEIMELSAALENLGRSLLNAIDKLEGRDIGLEARLAVNGRIFRAGRKLLVEDGLKRRPWYKHTLFAPHPDLGYGTTDLPTLTDALMKGDRDGAQDGAAHLISALRNYLNELDAIRQQLERLGS